MKKNESFLKVVDFHAPVTGTFYRSAYPGFDPFVDVGKRVKKGDVLCIIESMKSISEIRSSTEGYMKEIHADNEETVMEGQLLFSIRESSSDQDNRI